MLFFQMPKRTKKHDLDGFWMSLGNNKCLQKYHSSKINKDVCYELVRFKGHKFKVAWYVWLWEQETNISNGTYQFMPSIKWHNYLSWFIFSLGIYNKKEGNEVRWKTIIFLSLFAFAIPSNKASQLLHSDRCL